jgi:hypothetical protein
MTTRHPDGLFLPRPYVCYCAIESFEIDGNLDKSVWQAASWTDRF